MKDSFVDLLQSLTNDAEPVAGVRLSELSDLDAESLEQFAGVWIELPADRRQTLLEELGLMADSQIELSFEAINRLALDDADSAVRQQAIENLWESEDPRLASEFRTLLEGDTNAEVRAAAGKALGAFVLIGEVRSLDAQIQFEIEDALLQAAGGDPSFDVRNMCLQSLGYSSRSEIPELIHLSFAEGSEASVISALRAMARSANPVWSENVMSRLHDPSPQIRLEAVRAAGDIGTRESLRDLVELLDDVDQLVRRAAVWSLSQIGGRQASAALNDMAEEELDERETDWLRDAIDNLAFVEGARDLLMDDSQDLRA